MRSVWCFSASLWLDVPVVVEVGHGVGDDGLSVHHAQGARERHGGGRPRLQVFHAVPCHQVGGGFGARRGEAARGGIEGVARAAPAPAGAGTNHLECHAAAHRRPGEFHQRCHRRLIGETGEGQPQCGVGNGLCDPFGRAHVHAVDHEGVGAFDHVEDERLRHAGGRLVEHASPEVVGCYPGQAALYMRGDGRHEGLLLGLRDLKPRLQSVDQFTGEEAELRQVSCHFAGGCHACAHREPHGVRDGGATHLLALWRGQFGVDRLRILVGHSGKGEVEQGSEVLGGAVDGVAGAFDALHKAVMQGHELRRRPDGTARDGLTGEAKLPHGRERGRGLWQGRQHLKASCGRKRCQHRLLRGGEGRGADEAFGRLRPHGTEYRAASTRPARPTGPAGGTTRNTAGCGGEVCRIEHHLVADACLHVVGAGERAFHRAHEVAAQPGEAVALGPCGHGCQRGAHVGHHGADAARRTEGIARLKHGLLRRGENGGAFAGEVLEGLLHAVGDALLARPKRTARATGGDEAEGMADGLAQVGAQPHGPVGYAILPGLMRRPGEGAQAAAVRLHLEEHAARRLTPRPVGDDGEEGGGVAVGQAVRALRDVDATVRVGVTVDHGPLHVAHVAGRTLVLLGALVEEGGEMALRVFDAEGPRAERLPARVGLGVEEEHHVGHVLRRGVGLGVARQHVLHQGLPVLHASGEVCGEVGARRGTLGIGQRAYHLREVAPVVGHLPAAGHGNLHLCGQARRGRVAGAHLGEPAAHVLEEPAGACLSGKTLRPGLCDVLLPRLLRQGGVRHTLHVLRQGVGGLLRCALHGCAGGLKAAGLTGAEKRLVEDQRCHASSMVARYRERSRGGFVGA
ncbi:conserved hypothetical protein (plasmid) [Nitratidesulfovibrio vulgaris DP4]|uniref:Uncharacterized protein n=1 Tax=Nitratidesulfovibrio vulgaris (strain DP4) TaxID=391774 RepID=A0A0H3ADP0_NITV4|nr:conserved hypothetical protein [Nitratidesulfovibrio vulgaris DP4]